MKKISIWTIFLTAVLTLAWGCSSDENDNGSQLPAITATAVEAPPVWKVDWTWNDPAPDWQAPAPEAYENRMYTIYRLHDGYTEYSTDDDRMALFIGGECRGVSTRSVTDHGIYFTIMAAGSEGERDSNVYSELKYYCGGIHHIFTAEGYGFAADAIYGDTYDITFELGAGSPKYQQCYVYVETSGTLPFTPGEGDVLGVFVGDECRGTGTLGKHFSAWLTQAAENVQLRYYSAETSTIYTVTQSYALTTDKDFNSLIIQF